MKKLLALVLALVMTLSLAVVGSNAAFTDADKVNETYSEAVNVLSGMKVFQGYTDGSFQPTGDITRAEVAAIVYRLYTGDVSDTQASLYATYNKFSDMDGAKWAAGYIGYCANAGLIKGYDDKTFGPSDKVTGYQALAMILRAVGYDANDEFTGAQWQLRVASTAQQAGVLVNIKGVDLNAAASRELVAELLFRTAATVPMVKYTPAFGYVANTVVGAQKTLGEQNFNLKKTADSADVWGRPANVWTYNTGDKKTTVVAKPVATYTTKVDECDIAKDLGITKNTSIEKAFIDGIETPATSNAVTSNQYASINPLATTSYVGAQGRLTEVYDMGTAGYRIVEINTYLATIDKVTPAYTDRNTHTTVDTVNLSAYTSSNTASPASFKNVEASGFTVDQYVLVTISNVGKTNAAVESVVAATVADGGTLTGWTNAVGTTAATSVIGTTTYNDADKFFLNKRAAGNWMVITDTYGNVIGLTATATNYLVIEKIEWKSDAANIGGYAMADLKLADGSEVKGATIATVNSKTANSAANYSSGDVSNGWVSYYYSNNTDYYGHLFTYSVNANGSYNIVPHGQSKVIGDITDKSGAIVNGQATISGSTNTYVATNSTIFLMKNSDGYSYTVYTGKDNVPSVTGANLCILTNSNGYATLVVVSDYTLAANTFYAYVTNNAQDGWYKDPVKGYAYTIYKAGETTPTTVYAKDTANWTYNTTEGTGLYQFTVNSDNQITSMTCVICDLHCGVSAANVLTGWDRSSVKAGVLDGSFQTIGYSAIALADNDNGYSVTTTSAVKDFNVNDDTKYIVVTKNALTNSSAVLTAGDKGDLTAGSVVLVNYSTVGSKYTAKTVYILKVADNGVNNPVTVSNITIVADYPIVGGHRLGEITSPDSKKVTYDAQWIDATTGELCNANTIAVLGHTYTIEVSNIAAQAGYQLAESGVSVNAFTKSGSNWYWSSTAVQG